MNQVSLFRGHHLPSVYRYALLFEHLPRLQNVPRSSRRGRPSFDRNFLLRALVYRCLRRIPTLTELVFELENNPSLVEALGSNPLDFLPPLERFSAFLRKTENSHLQEVCHSLTQSLIREGAVAGKHLGIDSCPVEVQVRENNPKTRVGHARYDKSQPPRGDPQAGIGVRIHFPGPGSKEVVYFWGYRNHTVTDLDSELPIHEETHPANVSEVTRAQPLLRATQTFHLPVEYVMADAEYDVEAFLRFVVEELHAQPIVPHNPRREQSVEYSIRGTKLFCAADLPMASRGTVTPKQTGITYRQYGCPIHWLKAFQRQYLGCPIGHPKFIEQKGCNVLIRQTPSIRSRIPYGTDLFRKLYNQRSAAERSYSRLLVITLQHPTVRGLQAVQNHCTIAHIATLLVALTAVRRGEPDKIRWIKSFVPLFLKT